MNMMNNQDQVGGISSRHNMMVNCANSTTTGVILGATSTMPIGDGGENGGISGILNSAMLNKDMTLDGAS